uniref:GH18 domain-containing protein n=1 Tax=Cairina moschata TaxID=8855 RepID=A0A8C3BM77_CAIMO
MNAQIGTAYVLSCYFTNWAQYRPGLGKYMPDNIDPCLCDHLIYAFAGMSNNEITTYEWNDETLYKSFNGLKKQNENLKTLLAIGGWNFGTCCSFQRLRETVSLTVRYLDYFHVMTYDFHGSWDGKTGENSPLYKSPVDTGDLIYFNVDYAMNYWKNNGAPAEKLLVGFPTYGHNFILQNPSDTAVGAPASGPGPAGPYTRQAGFLAYYEICTFLDSGATQAWDAPQDVPYAYKGNEWVGYDNIKSFNIKIDWLKKNNFGGAMVWSLDMDDFTGTFCKQGKYPLITTLKNALGQQGSSE